MKFKEQVLQLSAGIERLNPHLSATQIADMVFAAIIGEWQNTEADRRNHAMIRRIIGCP